MLARVDPDEHLRFEWSAFFLLSTERQIGMGIGPIPWSSIDAYARRFGVGNRDAFEDFTALVVAMDVAYLGHLAAKNPDKGAT